MTQIDPQGAAEHAASSNQPAMASWLRSLEQSWRASEAKADHAIVSDSSDIDAHSEGNDQGTGGSESDSSESESSENESGEGESTTVDPQPRPVSVSSKLEAAIVDELEKGLMGYRCDQTQ